MYLHLKQPCSNTYAEFEEDVRQAEAQLTAKRIDQLALEEAGSYSDDKALHDLLDNEATGGELYDALHQLYREILETGDDEPITVGSTLRRAVERVGIQHFRPAVEALHQ